ncbi:MAG: hypothetical protein ACLGSD_09580 [Acidobacteriota bacterium]
MTQIASTPAKTWPITLGAEGMAAAQFARCGFDVMAQAGRDKPWYDLVVTRAGNLLKVAVKASEDGQWSLTQGYTRRPADVCGSKLDCHASIDRWLASYGSRTVCCLVQFDQVALNEMPRIYLAFPWEIADRMREAVERVGLCALLERYTWTAPDGSRRIESLPSSWVFSESRLDELQQMSAPGFAIPTKPHPGARVIAISA